MPRPPADSRVRRFMMQAIMWVILGATLGVAAMLDRHKRAALEVHLGEPVPIAGWTIRVPQNWLLESSEDGNDRLELREPGMDTRGRTIEIEVGKATPISLFKLLSRPSQGSVDRTEVLRIREADWTLVVRRIDNDERFSELTGARVWRFTMTRELRDGQHVTVALEDIGANRVERTRDLALVKEIAGTFAPAATTQP